MSILLQLLLTSSAVVATIHQDRRQAFRPAAQRLPEELEDRIWDFYPKVMYGDNPNSPILLISLEETQALFLFPPLHLVDGREDEETFSYESERLNQTMTKVRYVTLYVTDSTDRGDNLGFIFTTESECEFEMRYFVANETVHQWPYHLSSYWGYSAPPSYIFIILKAEMNRELEPGTEILLYIPQGCTLKSFLIHRRIEKQHFNSQAAASWSTSLLNN